MKADTGKEASGEEIREAIDTSQRGAPAAGEAVPDIFSAEEIFERILTTADKEFSKPPRLLVWSGVAAGLIMSLSFMAMAAIAGALPEGSSRLVPSLAYPLSFIIIALGRYQLYTENTLTPVTLVLTRVASIPRLLKIWTLVLVANVIGTAIAGFFFAKTSVFGPDTTEAALAIGKHTVSVGWNALFFRGIIAGWLVAGMVWLNHSARDATARVLIAFVLIYPIAAADLAHCIVGSSEAFYLVFKGELAVLPLLWGFLIPATLGNTVGGVLLVAILNHAQTEQMREEHEKLSWRTWFFSMKWRSDPQTARRRDRPHKR